MHIQLSAFFESVTASKETVFFSGTAFVRSAGPEWLECSSPGVDAEREVIVWESRAPGTYIVCICIGLRVCNWCACIASVRE
jgi:hypothetical protein